MGFSPLADMKRRIPDGGRRNPRNSKITGVGIHHQAGINAHGEASNPAREVSANYWITNEGVIIPNVDENYRAWTSGHINYPAGAQADHRNITIEVSNSKRGGNWPISDAAMKALIALIGDIYKRHGLGKVTRGANKGVGVHRDWVPTACPGNYIMDNLGMIIREAEKARTGGKPAPKPKPVPKPKRTTKGKTDEQLAREVWAGVWGSGASRQKLLGNRYAGVQAWVNHLYYGAPKPGSGGGSASKPKTSNSAMKALAKRILRGDFGNEPQRSVNLRNAGYNPSTAQAWVEYLYYGGPKPKGGSSPAPKKASTKKSTATIAKEIVQGDHTGRNPWGNEPQRSQRLRKAGYSQAEINQIQAQVNRMV